MNPAVLAALAARSQVPRIARLSNRSIIYVTGSQAPSFLNGVLATSVTDVKPFYSVILNAQGRILHDLFAYTTTERNGRRGFLIEFDNRQDEGTPLLALLKRYVLRSKVKVIDATEEYDVWTAWGDASQSTSGAPVDWRWAKSGAVEPVWSNVEWPWGNKDHVIRDQRGTGMGQRLLVRKGDLPQEKSSHELVEADEYLLHRILNGIPEGSKDISPEHLFPMDANMDVMGALDFRKGCYVGQELTVRTYHNGIVRKRILPVEIVPSPPTLLFSAGTDIRPRLTQEGSRTRPRGTSKLLSSIQGVGLAHLRLEHVESALAGDLVLEMQDQSGQMNTVKPWWPSWWPKRLV